MILKNVIYDKVGIARGLVIGDSGNEYPCAIDIDLKRSWCACPSWVYKQTRPCKHILYLMNHIERIKMEKGKLNFLTTDCQLLDNLLGGGIPFGTITAIFGQPKTGKSMLSYQILLQNAKETGLKSMYVDTEGVRPQDFDSIISKFNNRQKLTDKQVKDLIEYRTTLADPSFTSIQKLFQYFGVIVTTNISKGGRYTVNFDTMAPKIRDATWEKTSLCVIDSMTEPLKVSVGANTANLPARAQLTERLFAKMIEVAIKHNVAFMVNHHASVDPMTPYIDHGKMWGGDPILYNSKYALQFINATSKIKTDTGWGLEARRVLLLRRPDEQDTGEKIPIRLKKDWGYTEK